MGRHLMRCHHWMSRHHPNLWLLNVPVDVKPVVFAGQDHRAVIHQGNVEALGVLNLTLECRQDLKKWFKKAQSCTIKNHEIFNKKLVLRPKDFRVYNECYLSVLREDGEVEVVVVVCDSNLAGRVDADADGIVGNA